ncbi:MAG: electron transport complex subunit RsxC [Hydrogenophilales bacterium]|nr:electron transport complex subunit RsxC [Hydrogenophilales bacterium]
MRKLFDFHGGVHPAQHKAESTALPIAAAPLPAKLIVPMHQHIGNRAKPIVAVGERVLKGQMIGQADGYISCAVHAPASGIVRAIEMATVPHPSALPDLCISIEPDGAEQWVDRAPLDYTSMNPSELRNRLRDLGLAGMGGAVFPSHAKLNPGRNPSVPTLILNGAECEPWITCDDLLMRERAEQIIRGAKIMQHMLGATEVLIGIEDNKPEAIQAMRAACAGTDFEVAVVPTKYPSGGAKQLTKMLTGKEPPAGGRSIDIGVQVFNVATAYSLARAVLYGEPLISRVVTVTGNVERPQNFEALIGTPAHELVALAGPPRADTGGYIMGGPMMGFNLPSDQTPLIKATNCLIATSPKLFPAPPPALPCIRCTQCAQACPVNLQPQDLYWFARAKEFGKAQEYDLFDCIECGCCDYVCPSHIPLVQYYRFAKSEIWAREREKNKADVARERHEFRDHRIEREKKERADKLAAKTQGPKTPATGHTEADIKQAAIQAAIDRAKLKRAGVEPKNVDNLPADKLQEIREIEARRAQLKHAMEKPTDTA